ncbi:MAG: hypothetical protein ACE3L7_04745 [Candidatus Pristimantibacillus sp.]
MEENNICPWCMTEIVWDEEIGPEKHCPHCDNELSNYRTVQFGMGEEEDDEEEAVELSRPAEEEEEDSRDSEVWNEQDDGFRRTSRSWLGVEGKLQEIIDSQEEAPECPSCREYMIEAGKQQVGDLFQPTIHSSVGQAVLQSPFEVVWYICPSCFNTTSILSHADRERMVQSLSPTD